MWYAPALAGPTPSSSSVVASAAVTPAIRLNRFISPPLWRFGGAGFAISSVPDKATPLGPACQRFTALPKKDPTNRERDQSLRHGAHGMAAPWTRILTRSWS